MNNNQLSSISKKLSYILRHDPEKYNIKLEKDGWANVLEIIKALNITFDCLETIVKNDSKTRYSFNSDKTKIKANQGHSVSVEINFKKVIPPKFLYHGTAESNFKSIMTKGLMKGTRQYVHLSSDKDTAIQVARRHSKDIYIFEIDTTPMIKDNVPFYLSENNVWLVDYIPTKYLKFSC